MPQFIGSTTPLGASATYTSPWVNTDYYANVTGSVLSDQSGTLYIDQSGDKTMADVSTTIAVTGGTGSSFNATVYLPYLRFRYVNGSSAQTEFRLFPRWIVGGQP